MRRKGIEVITAGIRGEACPELAQVSHSFRYFGLGRLGAGIRYFRRHGVREVSWAGWIRKERVFRPYRLLSILPDWRMIRFYFFRARKRNRQDHTLLGVLADEFEAAGIHVSHSAKHCPELLAEEGIFTKRKPNRAEMEDIQFGWGIAKRLADLDVGQSVAVHEKATLAVESIEGTDRNIRRAGEFCKRGGFTIVKLAKDGHDMRFDIPAIGPETIDALHEAGGKVLAVEAGKTLLIDREELIARADRHGIAVGAWKEPPPPE
jgi:DUF1009 family protein